MDTLEITQGDGQCCPTSRNDGDAFEDNKTFSLSVASSVMTVEELSDSRGFGIVCWMVFLADMCRGVVYPTLWPLIESLGGSEVQLGYAVAAFSFGRAIASPVLGSWSHSFGYTRTLLASTAVLFVGGVLYGQVPNVGSTVFMTFVQVVLGVGSATLGVSRAFTAEVTAQRARTTHLAWLSAVQYFGFACTPLVGSLLANIFEDEGRVVDKGFFLLNAYTAPGYVILFFCLITLGLILTFFRDRQRASKAKSKKSKKRAAMEEVAASTTMLGVSTHTASILGMLMLNIVTKGAISAFETLGTNIAMEHFGLTASDAGYIVAVCGFLGVIELLCMGRITKYLTDVQMIAGGCLAMIAGMASLIGLDEDGNGDDAANNPTWRYVFAIFMVYTVGFSIAQAAVLGLFSKIVGRIPQGALMGWFSVVGAGSRVVYPIVSGYIVHYQNVGTLFIILIFTLGLAIAYVATNRATLSHLSY